MNIITFIAFAAAGILIGILLSNFYYHYKYVPIKKIEEKEKSLEEIAYNQKAKERANTFQQEMAQLKHQKDLRDFQNKNKGEDGTINQST